MEQRSEKLGRIIKDIINKYGVSILTEPMAKRFYGILTDTVDKSKYDLTAIKAMCEAGMMKTISELNNSNDRERSRILNEEINNLLITHNCNKDVCNEWIEGFCYAFGWNWSESKELAVTEQYINTDIKKTSEVHNGKLQPEDSPIDEFVLGSLSTGYTIQKYIGSHSTVVIPDTIREHAVIAINAGAFENNTTLEEIWIPKGVVIIGKNSFRNCTKLKEVHAHENIKSILDGAFQGCISILHMDFGHGVPGEKLVNFSPKTVNFGKNAFCNTTWKAEEKNFVVKEAKVNATAYCKTAFSKGIPLFTYPFFTSSLNNTAWVIIDIFMIILLILIIMLIVKYAIC